MNLKRHPKSPLNVVWREYKNVWCACWLANRFSFFALQELLDCELIKSLLTLVESINHCRFHRLEFLFLIAIGGIPVRNSAVKKRSGDSYENTISKGVWIKILEMFTYGAKKSDRNDRNKGIITGNSDTILLNWTKILLLRRRKFCELFSRFQLMWRDLQSINNHFELWNHSFVSIP